jgi:hypothetical protein
MVNLMSASAGFDTDMTFYCMKFKPVVIHPQLLDVRKCSIKKKMLTGSKFQ